MVVLFTILALGLESGAADPPPTYLREVKPLLDVRCAGCHSEKNLKERDLSGGLALDSLERMMKGGVVVPGNAKASELVKRIRTSDPDDRMPRKAEALPEESIVLIERWIESGAPRGEAEPATGSRTAVPALTPVPPPRFRPVRPVDVRIPLALSLPKGFPAAPGDFPREKLEARLKIGPLPPVASLAFISGPGAPGDLLAAGGFGTVTVWDLAKAEAVRALTAVPGTVNTLRPSPDGRLLAVGGGRPGEGGVVAVVETSEWKTVHLFADHRESVLDLAISPDGALLASASIDKTVKVWDLRTGQERLTITEHSDAVHAVAFLDGGKTLASAGADRSIKLTDVATGKVFRSLAGHEKPVLALAADPEGKILISSGFEPALRVWNPVEGKTLRSSGGHSGRVEAVAWSRDGRRVASAGSDRSLRLWSAGAEKELKSLKGSSEWLYSVEFDRDGRRVAAGAWDGTLRIWDVESGRELGVLIALPAAGDGEADWALVSSRGWFRASAKVLEVARLGAQDGKGPELPLSPLGAFLSDRGRVARALRFADAPGPLLGPERQF